MADKNWQAGSRNMIPAGVVACLLAIVAPIGLASAARTESDVPSYISTADPGVVWETVIGGIVVYCLLVSITLWVVSVVRTAKRAQLRRNAYVSSALNNL